MEESAPTPCSVHGRTLVGFLASGHNCEPVLNRVYVVDKHKNKCCFYFKIWCDFVNIEHTYNRNSPGESENNARVRHVE